MNTLLSTADRNTHIKIVVVALVAAIAVAAVGINARRTDIGPVIASPHSEPMVKAGKPAKYAIREGLAIR